MNKSKGFTLIELLVVIAIIGILSSVVLASLNSARTKSREAAAKSEISSMRAEAELYFSNKGTYQVSAADSVCTTQPSAPNPKKLLDDAVSQMGGITAGACNASATAWAAAIGLYSGGYFCVDSTGTAAVKTNGLGVATQCPAL